MHSIRILLASIALATTAAPAAAQTAITVSHSSAARVSLKVGYGGHGPDLDASIESPLFKSVVRFRASAGQGKWVGMAEQYPPAGNHPSVARLAGMVMIGAESGPPYSPPLRIRWYVGAGITALVPRGVDMNAQRGKRVLLGMDFSRDRWTVAPEIEIDLPRPNDVPRPHRGDDLVPTARLGLALRRHF